MHIYIGGAHNGKREFVRAHLGNEEIEWFEGGIPEKTHMPVSGKTVVAGLEKWLAQTELIEEQAIERILESLQHRDVIVILTDIGRGIVPMDAAERQLRDVCGRLNQQLVAQAEEVTRIWYGIPQTLKKRGENDENLYTHWR